MKEKIFELLKQGYSSLGLGDEILQEHAATLAGMGFVTDENIQKVVDAQASFLKTLQIANDKRVTTAVETAKKNAKKEAEDAYKKKEDERKAKEDEEKKRKEEEEARKKQEEELEKKTGWEKALAEFTQKQSEQFKDFDARFKKLTEDYTSATAKVSSLQEELKKRDASEKERQRFESINKKALELGIPQSRIDEGFVIDEDADDSAISAYLSKVANNYKAILQPKNSGFSLDGTDKPDEKVVESVVKNLVK